MYPCSLMTPLTKNPNMLHKAIITAYREKTHFYFSCFIFVYKTSMTHKKDNFLSFKDIKTTCMLFKKYHRLKIAIRNHYFIVHIYNNPKDLISFVDKYEGKPRTAKASKLSGAYLVNISNNKKIGTIALTFQALAHPLIIHECSHAALSYHSTIFNKNDKPTINTSKQEEFFCDLVSFLYAEITNYTTNSYRTLNTRIGKTI